MADFSQVTTHDLTVDGRSIAISVAKTAPTTLQLTWNLPANPVAYDGAVVLLSEQKITSDNYPVDGTRYVGSSNWTAAADLIGQAHVVAAFYGFFNNNIQQTSVTVTNVDPNKLYYASIHASSNVLQYYTIGSQSYPLDPIPATASAPAYAGSIPSSTTPPENPTNGQAYFDPINNIVLVWNDSMGTWVKSSQQTVPVGQNPPINLYQLFYNSTSGVLKFFDGTSWVACDPTNTQVKMGAGWAPFTRISAAGVFPATANTGDFLAVTLPAQMSAPNTYELKFFSLGSWFYPTPTMVQVKVGLNWFPIVFVNDSFFSNYDPLIPNVGDFFYQTNPRHLMAWNGSGWIVADTAEEGVPTSDKLGIGDDGSYQARMNLINVLKHQLGWPKVCVELTEEQFNIAVNNALDEFRRRADNAYANRFISFTIKQNQTTYYLNDPRDKTDRIVNVMYIHRINQLGISSLSAETGLYAQAFFNQLYQGSNVDVLSIHLMNQLSKTYEKIFAGNLQFVWDEATRELLILRRILQAQERVVLEVSMERTEQELLVDRWAKQWLQGWAESELIEMLAQVRSKYGTLPGAQGGLSLNGDQLFSLAQQKQEDLLRQITDYEVGNGGIAFGNTSFYIG
jgi:hypothetical protein